MKLRTRIAATLLVVAILTTGGVVASASADGVPPSALPGCSSPSDRGGWILRDFNATGNDEVTPDPVRPRNIRLGEPCYADGQFLIPSKLTEVPIEDFDGDGDGCSTGGGGTGGDGCSGGGGGGGGGGVDGGPPPPAGNPGGVGFCGYQRIPITAPITLDQIGLVGCNKVKVYGYTNAQPTGTMTTTVQGNITVTQTGTAAASVTFTRTVVHADIKAGNLNLFGIAYYRHPTTGVITWGNTPISATTSDTTKTWSISYTQGTNTLIAIILDTPGYNNSDANYRGGTIWRKDGGTVQPLPATVGDFESSRIELGEVTSRQNIPSYLECSSTRTGATSNLPIDSRYTFADAEIPPYEYTLPVVDGDDVQWSRDLDLDLASTVDEADCPFLVSVHLTVCVWVTKGPNEFSCTGTIWHNTIFQRHDLYDDEDPETQLCTQQFWTFSCGDILYPPYVDYTDFDTVCANPPEAAWLDFTWLPRFIGHYVHCIFVPQGGWDSSGKLGIAWSTGVAGDVTQVVDELAASFTFSETCGVLVNGSSTPIASFVIDSCSWSSWGAPMHLALALFAWVGFGIWAATFVLQTLAGVVNRKSPTPIAAD